MRKRADSAGIPADQTRRALVRTMLGLPVAGLAASYAYSLGAVENAFELAPTLACGDDDDDVPTPSQTEGPYFTPHSPERVSLVERGLPGTRLILSGQVLSTVCDPLAGALLDFWQADADGEYDNKGFRLRGHQFTGRDGRFTLDTIVPGLYPGRTRHIHVKVQAPGGRVLTTQLYFPSEPQNARDRIYSPKLLMAVESDGELRRGQFNFVLRT